MSDPTIFEYQVQDDGGLKNRIAVYEAYDGATTTVDSLIGSWLQLGGLLDPCIDAEILQGQITIPLEKDGSWKASAAVGNNCNQLMVLDFENDFDRYLTELTLPSYKEALLTPARIPDLADPALAALIAYMIAGDTDIFPQSQGSRDLDALRKAFLTVRKVRNNRNKTTVTT
jgi:hypothetical protein